jgi:hypothetical protein
MCLLGAGCRPPHDARHDPIERSSPAADIVVAPGGRDGGAGTPGDPVGSIARGLELLRPGRTLLISAGRWVLAEPIEVRSSGEPEAWLRIVGEAGTVLDARELDVAAPQGTPPFAQDQGALALLGVRHVEVEGLTIVHSHNAGISVRDSSHVRVVANRTSHTFSSGIAVWDSEHVDVLANEVARGSDAALAPAWFVPSTMVAPHESLTLSGVEHFVVAGNEVHHGRKEGIDVKGDSKHGVVENNRVHDQEWQGIYVDAWDGTLVDIEVRDNDVHRNRGAGIVISAEGEGAVVEDVRVHDNRIVENYGSGLFVTRFGRDGVRRRLAIHDNEVRRNGWGPPHGDVSPYHWITGGLYLFSVNVDGMDVFDNVFVDNRGFQIGCSDDYRVGGAIEAGLKERAIRFERNTIEPAPEIRPWRR